MSIVRCVACAILAIVFAITTANACSCVGNSSPCSSLSETPVVFVGNVIAVEETKEIIERFGKPEEIRTSLLAHFEIEKSFKGLLDNRVNINVETGGGHGDCGYDFKAGERYIVYADGDPIRDRNVATSICSRTQQLPKGQQDVDLIEAFLKGQPEARIFGTLPLYGRELGSGPFDMKQLGGAAGIRVEARDGTNTLAAITDSEGRFEIRNVPQGNYEVRPVLPSAQSGYLGVDQARKVEIRLPYLCGTDVEFLIQTNGVIRGRLFDAEGKPVARNVEVSILTAESAMKDPAAFVGNSTWTEDGGTFEFNGLMPGDYVVGVGVLHPPNWRSAYSRIYFPSTTRLGEAQILHVAEGEKLNDVDIHLPTPTPIATVRGFVFEADGRPAIKADIEIFDVEFESEIDRPEGLFETGTHGSFAITAIKERRYQVRAYRPTDYFAGTGLQSEPVEITTPNELRPVILTLTKPGIFRKGPR
jgi:hypothetical protein